MKVNKQNDGYLNKINKFFVINYLELTLLFENHFNSTTL